MVDVDVVDVSVVVVVVVVQLSHSTGQLFLTDLPKIVFLQSRASNPPHTFSSSGNPLQIWVELVVVVLVPVVVVVVEVSVVVVFVPVVVDVALVVVEVLVIVVAVAVVVVVVVAVSVVAVAVDVVETHERHRTGQLATSVGPMIAFLHCRFDWCAHICGSPLPLQTLGSTPSPASPAGSPGSNKSSPYVSSPEPSSPSVTFLQVLQSALHVSFSVAPNKSDWH